MEASQYDLIIIGGGSAAFAAASTANDLQLNTLVINSGLPVGGTCVNVGCVPSKFLIRAAENIYKASHSPFRGVSPTPPNWSYKEIIDQKKELVQSLQQKKYLDVLRQLEFVTLTEGQAEFSAPNKVSIEGREFEALKIVIATGSTSSIPHIRGLNNVTFLTNDTLFDVEELPESLIILGGGYIGLEIAQAYRRFGSEVTIIEHSDRVLNKEEKEVTNILEDQFLKEGVEILTGFAIDRVSQNGKTIRVEGTDSTGQRMVDASHFLVAAGRKPNTESLKSQKIGLELTQTGHVSVNEFLETNIPGIYAIGDCTTSPAFVYTAAYEGYVAVKNAFQGKQIKTDYSALPYVIFTDPQIGGVGMDEEQAKERGIPYETKTLPLSEIPRFQAALETRGFIKLIRNTENDLLIGARVVASEGGELVAELALAIKYKIPVKELANSFYPYLTAAEGIKLAAIAFEKDIAKLSCCAH